MTLEEINNKTEMEYISPRLSEQLLSINLCTCNDLLRKSVEFP